MNLPTSAQMANFAKVQEQLFNVVKLQLTPNLEGFEQPQSFGIYRDTGGLPLGVTGKDFTPQQPKLLLDSFLDCSLDLSKLSYHEMKGGSKIRFEIPIKTFEFKNARKVGDVTDISLCIQTGFDGLTKTTLYLKTFRLICTNGMKNSQTEFTASFKNTIGNQGKIASLCYDVEKAVKNTENLQELYLRLDKIEVNQERINEFLLKVANLDVKLKSEFHPRTQKVFDAINESIALEFGRTGATAFGLLNGITHYTNHVASGSENPDYIFVDNGVKLNDKAMQLVSSW